jgi:membrane-associated protein
MSATGELIREIGTYSYFGIWGISIISNVVIPVPEEAVLLVLGYLAGTPNFNGFIIAPIVLSGLLLSDVLMYFFSKRGVRLVNLFYQKVFARRVENKREWIETHMNKVIFFSRFLVQLRFLGPFLAGQMLISWRRFILYDFLALIIYVPLYLLIGWYFHNRVELIVDGIGTIRNIIITLVGLAIAISISKLVYKFFLGENFLAKKSDDKKL